jgi:nucleoside 2-deoxyribosyltransferase
LIAVIDGLEIDSGVAAEIGRFLALKEVAKVIDPDNKNGRHKHIYALYTDVRQQGRSNQEKLDALVADGTENQFFYRNLYVVGGIKKHGKILDSIENLCKELSDNHG